jgi:HlyD family secretion protein
MTGIENAAPGAPPRAVPATPVARGRGWIAPVLAGGLLTLAAAGALYWSLARGDDPHFALRKIDRGPVTRVVTASGAINPVITVQVGSYVSGVIQARFCDYNTTVKKGQLCAKIDPRPYQIVVDQNRASLGVAKAQLLKDKANLAYAKAAYDRNDRLAVTKAVSRDALEATRNAYDQAAAQIALDEATVELKTAELGAAEINLGYTDIVSPVDGTVVSRNVEMGQTVAASFQTPTLFLIATDLSVMQVDANISESDIGAIGQGKKALFTVESFPGKTFEGTVTQVRQSPQTIQNVVTYDAVVSAPNAQSLLKPGMTATVRVVVEARDKVLRAPNQAFRYAPGGIDAAQKTTVAPDGSEGARLWVLRKGSPVAIFVTPGVEDDAFTEIVKGDLHEGDEIIVGEETRVARKR